MGWLEGARMIVSSLCVMRMIDNVDKARVSEGLVPVLKVHGVHLVLLAAEMVSLPLLVVCARHVNTADRAHAQLLLWLHAFLECFLHLFRQLQLRHHLLCKVQQCRTGRFKLQGSHIYIEPRV